ncbi:MAG: WbqC family protein [Bacteroidetes bacterium]|nr:WbqC family protein [Bacteroidota bacterium]
MKPKKTAILQSNYIPWRGYFDIIASVDEFIIYDEVQYTKNDWRNRNRIKTPEGLKWITIPVYQKRLSQKIAETEISDQKWNVKHWNLIKSNYAKASHFDNYCKIFELFYQNINTVFLSEVNESMLRLICNLVGIKTKITNSSAYQLNGNPTERLVNLCKQTGAEIYVSGPAAKNYLQEDLFVQENIKIEWMDYSGYPEYPQLSPPFDHRVSIIDLLFNTGAMASRYMKIGTR